MEWKYEVNDHVRLKLYPEDHVNGYARVTKVREDGLIEVTNMNMPYQGYLTGAIFTKNEIEPAEGFRKRYEIWHTDDYGRKTHVAGHINAPAAYDTTKVIQQFIYNRAKDYYKDTPLEEILGVGFYTAVELADEDIHKRIEELKGEMEYLKDLL